MISAGFIERDRARRWRNRLFGLVVTACVAWWLFGGACPGYASRAAEANTIRFAHFGSYLDYELWRDVIDGFERRYEGVHVVQEYIVGLAGQYNTKMRQQILSNTLPDVALVQLGPFHELAEHFADLTSLARRKTVEGIPLSAALDPLGLSAFQYQGRPRGLPVSGGGLVIYANERCFTRAEAMRRRTIPRPRVGWTMEEFRRTAELLTCDFDGDGRLDQFGFWLPRWVYYLPFLWSFGAELTDASLSRWTFVGAAAERALEFYRDIAVQRRVCPREGEVPQLFQDTGFLTGKVAMCVNGPWFQPFLARTRLSDSYIVAPIPRGPNGSVTRVTWDGVVMAQGLDDARGYIASEFIRWVLSQPVQDRIARSGRALPARTQSIPAFEGTSNDPRRRILADALSNGRLQPLLPRFGEVDRAINRHFLRLIDPERAIGVRAILDQLKNDPSIRRAFQPDGTKVGKR